MCKCVFVHLLHDRVSVTMVDISHITDAPVPCAQGLVVSILVCDEHCL